VQYGNRDHPLVVVHSTVEAARRFGYGLATVGGAYFAGTPGCRSLERGTRYGSVMGLKRLQRAGLLVLGTAALDAGVTASINERSTARVISLILPGVLPMIFDSAGVPPNVHLKEGNFD
jgi:hypothetical protein